ncbi:hypothetical protein SKTS_13740 [Sulfurimicrobium lacus]|uniref:Sialate O-acetylesterase domain-containing protein n=1 Tax=Sulfurimicrobium lacus TaxID=2715678 RepID=A0A6F8V9V5_9PROT|nr:sialate O-acetylesterase [Sulfurimicrobium lacus]BCB26488.1 hypothetical protein SKTS_13740 [Sulfurimicrobium lacus]
MEQIIDRNIGVHFGDMDAPFPFAGVASMFDGNLVANNPNFGAYKAGTNAYIGTEFAAGKIFSRAIYYGWNDRGILDDGSAGTVYIYGKNGVPENGTDGVLIGQASFTEPSPLAYGSPLTINSMDTVNAYTHIWAYVTTAAATGICGAELEMYEFTIAVEQHVSPAAIFIGAGQSNMVGAAPVPDQSIYASRARVAMFALDGTVKPAADPIMDATGSLWPQFNNAAIGCGTMLPFANSIVGQFKNFDALIVNSSKGSTSIDLWAKGSELYDGMIARTKAALYSAPYGSFIAGMVWQQGESDTFTEVSSGAWVDKFHALVANVRGDLNIPELPVVFVGLGPYDAFSPGWPQLRFSQQFMRLPANCLYVKSFDLANDASPDWLVTNSVLTIGERVSKAMLQLLPEIV